MSVEIKNNKIPEVKKTLEEKKLKAFETIGLLAEGYAKLLCPVGTPESTGIAGYIGGTLRNSITHQAGENEVCIGTNVEYGKYVELGTTTMQARPYLEPAITGHIEQYKIVLQNELKD